MPLFAEQAYIAAVAPVTLLFLRFAISAVVLQVWMWASRTPYPKRPAWKNLCCIGGIGFVLQSLCFFTAIRFANPALVAVLLYCYPILVTLAERVLWKVPLTGRKCFAIGLTSCGLMCTVTTTIQAQPLGIGLALLAAVIYAAYVLASSQTMRNEDPLPSCSVIFTSAALVFGGLMQASQQRLPTTGIAWGASIGVAACSVIAVVSLFAGIQQLGASLASTLSTLEPVVAIVFVSLLTGQWLTQDQLIGSGLILSGAIGMVKTN